MPAIEVVIKQIGVALMNQSNHSLEVLTNNSSDMVSTTSRTTSTPTIFSFSTTQFSTTTTQNTSTLPASGEDTTSWIYIVLGVLCWIAMFVGCGFAWTQLCKAFYFSSDTCDACARTCRRNPGISWLVKTNFFRFYFGNECCCCRENEEDLDDEVISSTTANDGNAHTNPGHEISGERTASGNTSIPSTNTNAPPPPYEVALFMRRPGDNLEDDDPATVTLSSHTEAQSLEEIQL